MITNDGKQIVAKFMLGQAPTFASYIAAGCGPEPLITGESASVSLTKKSLDFEVVQYLPDQRQQYYLARLMFFFPTTHLLLGYV